MKLSENLKKFCQRLKRSAEILTDGTRNLLFGENFYMESEKCSEIEGTSECTIAFGVMDAPAVGHLGISSINDLAVRELSIGKCTL